MTNDRHARWRRRMIPSWLTSRLGQSSLCDVPKWFYSVTSYKHPFRTSVPKFPQKCLNSSLFFKLKPTDINKLHLTDKYLIASERRWAFDKILLTSPYEYLSVNSHFNVVHSTVIDPLGANKASHWSDVDWHHTMMTWSEEQHDVTSRHMTPTSQLDLDPLSRELGDSVHLKKFGFWVNRKKRDHCQVSDGFNIHRTFSILL